MRVPVPFHPASRAALRLTAPVLLMAVLVAPAGGQRPDTTFVRTPGGPDAYIAWPSARERAPVVVVIQDRWGLDLAIRGVARRLAAEGYVTVVPDLSQGRRAEEPDGLAAPPRADLDVALAELDSALAWVRATPRADGARVAVLGFSLGAAVALEYAARHPEVAAVVTFYADPVTGATRFTDLKPPLLAHFGATDDEVPMAQVEVFRRTVQRAGRAADFHTYAGAGHAFMNDSGRSYHPDAARQAWARTLAFLQKHLRDRGAR